VIAGYGSGHIRLFSVETGSIRAEITAHAGKHRYLGVPHGSITVTLNVVFTGVQ
jgi:hypothetical protein